MAKLLEEKEEASPMNKREAIEKDASFLHHHPLLSWLFVRHIQGYIKKLII